MVFEIVNKVALITGGASGLGLCYAKELLRNGLRGVTLADIDVNHGANAVKEIEAEFGPNKAVFIKTDVTNLKEFEEAFKETVRQFKNVDILLNNAGILNDAIWEKQIGINVNGVVNGVLLGLENYIKTYKTGDDGLIVNISSIAAIKPVNVIPIYSGTKLAVLGMSAAWGSPVHFERTKVRVVCFCPGVTRTPLILDMPGRNLGDAYQGILEKVFDKLPMQEPDQCAKAMLEVIKKAETGTAWLAENGQPPFKVTLFDDSTKKIYLD